MAWKSWGKTLLKTDHWNRGRELIEGERRARLQAMSDEESIQAYRSLMAFAYESQYDDEGWKRLMERRWEDKLKTRRELLAKIKACKSTQST